MQITVKDLAKELKISIKELGSYLKDLGLPGKGSDILSSEDAQAVKEIIEKAKKEGKWLPGLDSNEHLFKELKDETKAKLALINSMIDEE